MSTSIAMARPTMSAPTPRSGSSTRWGSVGSSPATMVAASVAEFPGSEPTPVAAVTFQARLTGKSSASGGCPADSLISMPDALMVLPFMSLLLGCRLFGRPSRGADDGAGPDDVFVGVVVEHNGLPRRHCSDRFIQGQP